MIDPPRSDRLFEQAIAIDASLGLSPDPVPYAAFHLARLRRATGHDEARALLGAWLTNLGDSTPSLLMTGVFALYGDVQTALELKSRNPPPRTPAAQLSAEFSEALLASAQGQFDEAEQHLAKTASFIRDFGRVGSEADCLNGFAKVAVDRGDYARASRLLAAIRASAGPQDRPFDQPFATAFVHALIYDHCTGVLRELLDPEVARATEAQGAALSLKEALAAELSRSGTTAAGQSSGLIQ